jgi:hypothetical protein
MPFLCNVKALADAREPPRAKYFTSRAVRQQVQQDCSAAAVSHTRLGKRHGDIDGPLIGA